MNKTITTLFLCLSVFQAAMADPPNSSSPDQVRLWLTQSSLRNFGAALDMWRQDHDGLYPDDLQQLSPNYLRHVPPGPFGSSSDWQYIVSSNRRGYQVQVQGQPFGGFNLAAAQPSYDPVRGLQPIDRLELSGVKYSLQLPSSQSTGWERDGSYYHRDQQHFIGVALRGPFALSQKGEDWVRYGVQEFKNRPGALVESEKTFIMGELSGVEVRATWNGSRSHTFFATDGKTGWEFTYSADQKRFSPDFDAMFVEMVKNRKRS